MLLLLVHAFATLFMTGLIWQVQVVHYPLFAQVGRDRFVESQYPEGAQARKQARADKAARRAPLNMPRASDGTDDTDGSRWTPPRT